LLGGWGGSLHKDKLVLDCCRPLGCRIFLSLPSLSPSLFVCVMPACWGASVLSAARPPPEKQHTCLGFGLAVWLNRKDVNEWWGWG